VGKRFLSGLSGKVGKVKVEESKLEKSKFKGQSKV
jgi:hypothetical protein